MTSAIMRRDLSSVLFTVGMLARHNGDCGFVMVIAEWRLKG